MTDDTALSLPNTIPAMSVGSFHATLTGLVVEGEPTIEEWELYGQGLKTIEQSIQWLLGDWLNYGERTYGETYAQAMDEFQFELSTLKALKWTSSKVAPAQREPSLSWSHHRAVGSLPPKQQESWLAKAKEEELSRDDLRTELRTERFRLTTGTEPIYTQFKIVAEIEAFIVTENSNDVKLVFKDALFAAQFPFYQNELTITKVKVTKDTSINYIENE